MPFNCPKGVAGKNSSCHCCWLTIEQTQSSRADLLFSQSGDPKFCTTFPLPAPLTIGLGQLFWSLLASLPSSFTFNSHSPTTILSVSSNFPQSTSDASLQVCSKLVVCLQLRYFSPLMQGSWSPAGGVLRSLESHYLPSHARCWSSEAGVTGKFLLCSSTSSSFHMEYPNNCLSSHLKRCKDFFFFPKCIRLSYLHHFFWLKLLKLL